MKGMNLVKLWAVANAVSDADRATRRGAHDSARDDARRAFLNLGTELGLSQRVLTGMLLDLHAVDDHAAAERDGRIVAVERAAILCWPRCPDCGELL